jgi:3-oxoacyl-[acyl-carrier protein] reductase
MERNREASRSDFDFIFMPCGALPAYWNEQERCPFKTICPNESEGNQPMLDATGIPYHALPRMSQLAGQIAVVTGAGRGIGRAIALKFAAEGADVACVSRTAENSEKVAGEIRALNRKAWAHALDVTDAAAVKATIEKILTDSGKVDVLVNNAGVTRDGLLMRMSDADWDAVLDTNLKGAFLVTKAFSRAMLKQQSGRIINIASVIALIGNAGQCNYAASKAGLIGFTKSAAREFASRGVTVNAIAPGFIETDMTAELKPETREQILKQIPLGCFGQVDDIAHAALFLASPAARFITGQVLAVDGGMVM